jgi:succinate dehydrogenase / fumarate reductase iron-sulfur subunit
MEQVGFAQVARVAGALAPSERKRAPAANGDHDQRLVDYIECGLCVSACPIMATAISYLGPAALAAAEHGGLEVEPQRLAFVDHQDGAWRCHNTYECSVVCPSAVDPAARIMQLRKQIVGQRMRRLMRGRKGPQQ